MPAAMVEAPLTMVESLAELRLPARADKLLQRLMDRKTESALTPRRAR